MKQLTLPTLLAAVMGSSALNASPIIDTVTVNGVDWAQVDLFVELSWNDIDAVCPSGLCGAGQLNGYDMQGWTWASVNDLNALGNGYIGNDELGPGPDAYVDPELGPESEFAEAFFADGWRATDSYDGNQVTEGWVSETDGQQSAYAALVMDVLPGEGVDEWATNYLHGVDESLSAVGAWFYRERVSVSEPLSVSLFGLGLIALGFTRWRKPATI